MLCSLNKKEKKLKRKQKIATLMLLRGITKTFTGKQAQSGNSGNHFGEKADTFGQISQVEPSKASVGSYVETWQEGPPGDEE